MSNYRVVHGSCLALTAQPWKIVHALRIPITKKVWRVIESKVFSVLHKVLDALLTYTHCIKALMTPLCLDIYIYNFPAFVLFFISCAFDFHYCQYLGPFTLNLETLLVIRDCLLRLAAPFLVDWNGDGLSDLLVGEYDGRVRRGFGAEDLGHIGLDAGFPCIDSPYTVSADTRGCNACTA